MKFFASILCIGIIIGLFVACVYYIYENPYQRHEHLPLFNGKLECSDGILVWTQSRPGIWDGSIWHEDKFSVFILTQLQPDGSFLPVACPR